MNLIKFIFIKSKSTVTVFKTPLHYPSSPKLHSTIYIYYIATYLTKLVYLF